MKKIFSLLIAGSLSLQAQPLSEKQKKIALYSAAAVATFGVVYAGYYIIKKVNDIPESIKIITLDNGITIHQSLAQPVHNRDWAYTFDAPKDRPEIAFITQAEWGRISILYNNKVEKYPPLDKTKADVLIYSQPNQSFLPYAPWEWNENAGENKKTSHDHGIQTHEITTDWLKPEEKESLEVIILTMGVENALRTDARQETLKSYVSSQECKTIFPSLKHVYILPTPEAVDLYNSLAQKGTATILYAHMTC